MEQCNLCPWEATVLVAASTGDTAKLQQDLDKGSDVNHTDDEWRRPPLFWAIQGGHDDAVQLLLQRGADVNAVEPCFGRTALHIAALRGQETSARRLVDAGAKVNTQDFGGCTPLLMAAGDGHASMVGILAEAGADLNTREWGCGKTALSLAAEEGHDEFMKQLLDNDAAVDIADDLGQTALAWATEEGHEEIARLLMDHGEKHGVTLASHDGKDLFWAVKGGHTNVVQALLEEDADINALDGEGRTPLSHAAERGYGEVVSFLLEKGAAVDAAPAEGERRTPLSYAAGDGHAAVVLLLLAKGADVNVSDAQQWTPLAAAAERGHSEVVSLLLQSAAEPDPRDEDGFTPLLLAAGAGYAKSVSLLLDAGADPHARDSVDGINTMSRAAEQGHLEVVEHLLARKINPNKDDQVLLRALSLDQSPENYLLIKTLVEHGADVFMDCWTDQRPLVLAAESGYDDVVKLFLQADYSSSKVRQEHIRNAICEAADQVMKNTLDILMEHDNTPKKSDKETL